MKTEEYKGYTISILPDEMAESPRTECDNLGTVVCFHKKYGLGDRDHGYMSSNYDSWEELKRDIIRKENPAVILPVYMYDHSGITISTKPFSCRFDSGQIGFIFVSKAKSRYEYNWKHITKNRIEKLTKRLESEIETYDLHVTGERYGYSISKNDEEFDSCWGYYGKEDCLNEAKSMVDYYIKEEMRNINDCQLMMAL